MTSPFTQPIQAKLFTEIITSIQKAGINPWTVAAQKMALIMYHTLLFNRSLVWKENKDVYLVRTPQELIEIYQLRSTVFEQVSYSKDIPGDIPGFNFDTLDECSAVIYTKSADKITGTLRIIFDNSKQLPVEKEYSFRSMKQEKKQIAELSRLAIVHPKGGLNQDFKYLVRGAYYAMIQNDMDILVSVMIPEHYKFYKNFGGFFVEKELESYIGMERPFVVTSWEVSKISPYFKRRYLGIRKPNSTSKSRNSLDQLSA